MKVVVTRVSQASCTIEGKVHSKTGKGFLLLVGIHQDDTEKDLEKVAHKISRLRVFEDDNGKMDLDIHQINGEILSISQFTLNATLKGNRPGFDKSMEPVRAKEYYLQFNELLRNEGINVLEGVFQADMQIESVNDGPVTIIIDSEVL